MESKQSSSLVPVISFFRNELDQKAKLKTQSAIKTDSNLKSSVFSNIAKSIGIDTSPYESKYKLIDESLLKRRNTIAHGGDIDIDQDSFAELAVEVLALMRSYKTDIENAASQQLYLVERFRNLNELDSTDTIFS